jgi:hypothetical protein
MPVQTMGRTQWWPVVSQQQGLRGQSRLPSSETMQPVRR